MIYAYSDNNPLYKGMLKVGYTKSDVEKRVAQQYPTIRPGGKPYEIVFQESAMYEDGSAFTRLIDDIVKGVSRSSSDFRDMPME